MLLPLPDIFANPLYASYTAKSDPAIFRSPTASRFAAGDVTSTLTNEKPQNGYRMVWVYSVMQRADGYSSAYKTV